MQICECSYLYLIHVVAFVEALKRVAIKFIFVIPALTKTVPELTDNLIKKKEVPRLLVSSSCDASPRTVGDKIAFNGWHRLDNDPRARRWKIYGGRDDRARGMEGKGAESLIHVYFDRLHSLSSFDNGRIMRDARIRPHRLGQEMHYCV